MQINFDRDSVCIGDDMTSHAIYLDVDEKITVDDLIKILYSKPNVIAKIGGGHATWILQIKIKDYYKDIAVFAEQWEKTKLLSNSFSSIEELVKLYNPTFFFAKYLAQNNPEDVFNSLKKLRY